jgi:putative aldouronate transport system permease protein
MKKSILKRGTTSERKTQRLVLWKEQWRTAKQMRLLYLLLLLPLVSIFIFKYLPIYGIIIAFKDYRIASGFWASQWNGFYHFKKLFANIYFWRIFRNTLIISFLRLAFGYPAPIILALMFNEVAGMRFKRIVQSISYLPHFLSWVVLAGIIIEILSPQRGIVGLIYNWIGREPVYLLTSKTFFRPLLVVTAIWKAVGWQTIVYLAAISTIDPGLYESADIDGANRFQKAIFITVPSLIPVMVILFILRIGHILDAGFDQIFNLYNPLVYEVADIIDTYVYRSGIVNGKYDFTTAVGLFKNVLGVILILGANKIIKKYSEYALW